MSLRTLARLGAAPAVLGIAVLGVAAPAGAHVTITPSTTAAGAFAVLTVSVPHGCDGSPTTEIAIRSPRRSTPSRRPATPLWEVEKEVQQLDPPVTDAHGNEITERVATVTYTTDEPLPEGYRDSFELSVQVPDADGTTLVFPVVQTCEEGESAWIEVPAEGQSADDLELPAPGFTITEGGDDGHGDEAEAEETRDAPPSRPTTSDEHRRVATRCSAPGRSAPVCSAYCSAEPLSCRGAAGRDRHDGPAAATGRAALLVAAVAAVLALGPAAPARPMRAW